MARGLLKGKHLEMQDARRAERKRAVTEQRAAVLMAEERSRAEAAEWDAAQLVTRETPTLTLAEVARRRGVTRATINDARRSGHLVVVEISPPGTAPQRRLYRVSEAAYENYRHAIVSHRSPLDYPLDPDVLDRRHAEGWITVAEAARIIGITRLNADSYIRRKRLSVEREGVLFVKKADAHVLCDQRNAKIIASITNVKL